MFLSLKSEHRIHVVSLLALGLSCYVFKVCFTLVWQFFGEEIIPWSSWVLEVVPGCSNCSHLPMAGSFQGKEVKQGYCKPGMIQIKTCHGTAMFQWLTRSFHVICCLGSVSSLRMGKVHPNFPLKCNHCSGINCPKALVFYHVEHGNTVHLYMLSSSFTAFLIFHVTSLFIISFPSEIPVWGQEPCVTCPSLFLMSAIGTGT